MAIWDNRHVMGAHVKTLMLFCLFDETQEHTSKTKSKLMATTFVQMM
jgi:hypothetical protein